MKWSNCVFHTLAVEALVTSSVSSSNDVPSKDFTPVTVLLAFRMIPCLAASPTTYKCKGLSLLDHSHKTVTTSVFISCCMSILEEGSSKLWIERYRDTTSFSAIFSKLCRSICEHVWVSSPISPWVQWTVQFWLLVLELSLIWSELLKGRI